jgi:DNA-nicking Smr family endonuclease
VKLKLDLHDIYNRGDEIDKALKRVFDEAIAKKAPLIEIIPGKGTGQLKKHVTRFLEKNRPPARHYRIENDSKNWGRVLVHLRWLPGEAGGDAVQQDVQAELEALVAGLR